MAQMVGTWIYYDSKGNQLSKIQHNQTVRQNNDFTLFVAFDSSFSGRETEIIPGFKATDTAIKAYVKKPSKDDYDNNAAANQQSYEIVKFKKLSPTEITYGLVDGKDYIVYELVFSKIANGVNSTSEYGNINIEVVAYKSGEEESEYSLGVVDIYVQPTYNTQEDDKSDIEIIDTQLSNKLGTVAGTAYNIRLTSDPDKSQTRKKTEIIGEVDTTQARFSPLTNIENEDTTPATKGFVELKVDNLSDVVAKNLENAVQTLETKINDGDVSLDDKIDTKISEVNKNIQTNYSTTDDIENMIYSSGHVVDIDVASKEDLEKNNKPSIGIKYKTKKEPTAEYVETVTIPLPEELVVEEELHKEYKVKTIENGSNEQTSEMGYAKFSYNESNTVKAKMPTNMIYFVESEEGDGEPASSEIVTNAIRDGNDQNIAHTYIKNISLSLSKDTITLTGSNGNDVNKVSSDISLKNYAHVEDVPVKLNQLLEDENHKVVTEEEKQKWNEKEIQKIDSLAIYKSFEWLPVLAEKDNGKIVVAKSDGVLPLVIYKWIWNYENNEKSYWSKITDVKDDCLYICSDDGFVYKHIDVDPYFEKVNEIDVSHFVTKEQLKTTKDLDNYLDKTLTGATISAKISNDLLTISLLNKDGSILSSQNVQISIPSGIVNGSYNETDKSIELLLSDGTTISIPVADLTDGLVSKTYLDSELYNLNSDIDNLEQDMISKVNDSDLSLLAKTGSFVDLENKPTTISGYGITDAYIDGTTINERIIRLGNKTITPITNVTYDIVGSKPTLNTSNTESLEALESEEINNEISLHKVAKTGSAIDLTDYDELVKTNQINDYLQTKLDKPSNASMAKSGQALLFYGEDVPPLWGDVTMSGTMSLVGQNISVNGSYNGTTIVYSGVTSGDIYEIYATNSERWGFFTRVVAGTSVDVTNVTLIDVQGVMQTVVYRLHIWMDGSTLKAYFQTQIGTSSTYEKGTINAIYKVSIN